MRPWAIAVAALVGLVVGGLITRGCGRHVTGIEQRAGRLVTDSWPLWRKQDRRDSVTTDSLIAVADSFRTAAMQAKAVGMRYRRERDSLRILSTASQDTLDSLTANPPAAAQSDHPGVTFWQAAYTRQKQIAADFRTEADLARQGDVGFLGAITNLENGSAVDQKTIRRLRDQLATTQLQRDQAVATLDTLRRQSDCRTLLGIPCPQIGLGLGVTYGNTVHVGGTIGVYIPVKQIRL